MDLERLRFGQPFVMTALQLAFRAVDARADSRPSQQVDSGIAQFLREDDAESACCSRASCLRVPGELFARISRGAACASNSSTFFIAECSKHFGGQHPHSKVQLLTGVVHLF